VREQMVALRAHNIAAIRHCSPLRGLMVPDDFITLNPFLIACLPLPQFVFFSMAGRSGTGKQKGVLMPLHRLNRFCPKSVAIWRQWRIWICSAIVALAAGGCTTAHWGGFTADSPNEQKSAAVRERAEARWQALTKDDIATAYDYLSPTTREVVSLEQYRAKVARRRFREAKVEGVECEAELCKVKIRLTFDHPRMKGLVVPLEETWIIERGQFWYVYR
jgi:hypothetical protein